jgi:hypothetical protein
MVSGRVAEKLYEFVRRLFFLLKTAELVVIKASLRTERKP